MKKITVVSDSHGNRRALDGLDVIFGESDIVIHLGDTSADGSYIQTKFQIGRASCRERVSAVV